MQGSQKLKTHADLKCESVWFKSKLVSQFLTFSFLLCNPFFLPYLHAAPAGGQVVGGSGSISQSDLTTTINQVSQNLAVNWQSFNVKTNEKVNFVQPNSSSIALNRILGNNGSTIQGQINANGQVILVNPNGVFFTPTATVNVGGLVASSLDMTPDDFMNGNYIFNEVIGSDGAVINSGIINASLGGNVALLGKKVKNEGLISANLGSVVLAAGKQSVLTFDNQGLIGVKVTKEVLQNEVGLEEAVINSGTINASGGRVLLTASTSQDIFSQAVNNNLDQATSVVVNPDGSFTLGGGADVLNTGSIDVSSERNDKNTAHIVLLGENVTSSGNLNADVTNGKAGEIEIHANDKTLLTGESITSAQAFTSGTGGHIKVLGDKVGLFEQSSINASGANGGGEVLVGGDRQGQNPYIRTANFIYLGADTTINADATGVGNGGKIINFAKNTARIHGGLVARGGSVSGDGGFIETSGLRGFEITRTPDISASNGKGGQWLIDPNNIRIINDTIATDPLQTINITTTNPFQTLDDGAILEVGLIRTALNSGDVLIETTNSGLNTEAGNISFEGVLSFSISGGALTNTLTLKAANDITFTNTSSITRSSTNDSINLNLNAGGNISLSSNSNGINTYGGNLTVISGTGFDSSGATINLGNVSGGSKLDLNAINSTGDVVLGSITGRDLSILDVNKISQSAGSTLNFTGFSDLSANAATASIILNEATNNFGTVKLQGAVADIRDSGRIYLGAGSNITSSLKVTSGEDIRDSGAITVATATFDAVRDVILDGNGTTFGDFNAVNILNARNVDITDAVGSIDISAFSTSGLGGITGTLNLVENGSSNITDSGEVNVGGVATFTVQDSASIYLNTVNNTFGSTVDFIAAGTGTPKINDITVYNDAALSLGDLDITGALDVKGDTIAFANAIVRGSLTAEATSLSTSINSITQSSGSITNDNAANNAVALFTANGNLVIDNNNNFNNIDIIKGNNVTVKDVFEGIAFSANSAPNSGGINGTLNLTATNGDITSYGEINAGTSTFDTATFTVDNGRSIILDNAVNTFGGNVRFISSAGKIESITITDDTALELQAIDITGSLNSTASGITQNLSGIIVAGDTTLSSSADITLSNSNNDFNNLTISNGEFVSIRDSNAIRLISSNTNNDLSIQAGGDISLVGNIQTNTNAGSTTADVLLNGHVRLDTLAAGGTVTIDTSASNGTVTFTGDVNNISSTTQRNNLVINSANGNIDFQKEIGLVSSGNSNPRNIGSLIINKGLASTATVNLNSVATRTPVSDSTSAIDITAGTINLRGDLTTNGITNYGRGITLNGNVTLGANILLDTAGSTTDGAITIAGNIQSDSTARDLVIATDTGNVIINGNVGSNSNALSSLVINNGTSDTAGSVNVGSITTRGGSTGGFNITGQSITLNGDIDTTNNGTTTGGSAGDVTFNGNVNLGADVNIITVGTGSNGNVSFNALGTLNGNINSDIVSAKKLVINAGDENISVAGLVGNQNALQLVDLKTTSGVISVNAINTVDTTAVNTDSGIHLAASTVNLGGNLTSILDGVNGAEANIDITGATILNNNITVLAENSHIGFSSSINADLASNNRALTLGAGTGNITFNGDIGSVSAINSLAVTNTGTTTLQNVFTRDGGVDVTSGVININGNIDTKDIANSGAISLSGNINLTSAGSTVTFDTNSTGTDANITLAGSVNNTTTNAKNLVLNAGSANVSMTGNAGSNLVAGNGALNNLTVTGNTVSLGEVTSLNTIDITGISAINLGGNLTTTVSGSDILLKNANTTLGNNVTLTTTGSGNITFEGLLDADLNTNNRSLVINSGTGTVNFQGTVGSSQAINGLAINANTSGTVNLQSVNTRSGGLTVSTDTLNLSGNISTINDSAAAGVVSLSQDKLNLLSSVSITTNSAAGTDAGISILDSLAGGMVGNNNSLSLDAGSGTVNVTTNLTDISAFNVLSSQSTSLNGVVTNNGAITANANLDITLNGNYDSGTADMSFSADNDSNGSGMLIFNSTSIYSGQNLSFSAFSLSGEPTITAAGTGAVSFSSTTNRVVLGTNAPLSTFYLSNTFLDKITAQSLQVSAASNYILLNGVITTDNNYSLGVNGTNVYFYGADSQLDNITSTAVNAAWLYKNITATNDITFNAPTLYSYNYSVIPYLATVTSTTGNININTPTISGVPALTLTAANAVNFNGNNNLTLGGSLNVSAGIINHGNMVASNDINLTSGNAYTQTGSLESTGGSISITAVNGNVGLNYNKTSAGSVSVNAQNGNIFDNNGNVTNIETSGVINLTATGGIGLGDPLEIISNGNSVSLNATNYGAGNIELINAGNIRLQDINNLQAGGKFILENTGNVTVNSIVLSKAAGSDATFDVFNGNILGVQGNAKHLTANSAYFKMNNTGSIGLPGESFITDVPNKIEVIGSLGTYIEFYGNVPPNDFIGDNDYRNRALQAIESLSGQQLIQVESLAEIDPAIFTDVRNYNHSDIALMMPADQRYTDNDDEDEETKQKRNAFLNSKP